MNGKLCTFLILISFLGLTSTEINAQDFENISCINQFYHNWTDGVYDVCTSGNYAFLACGNEGLHILNISNDEAPIDVASFACGFARAVAVAGDYAYVGSTDDGMHIINIANSELPQEVRFIPMSSYDFVIRIVGDYAYVCARPGGLSILNISDPATAQVTWSSEGIYDARDIDVHGDIAYVACEFDGMQILDITDRTAPVLIGTFNLGDGEWTNGVSVSGNYAYLARGWDGLRVVDLSTMQAVARIDSLAYAYGLKIVGNHLFVNYGDPECPLAIVDISNPLSPQTLGIYHPPEDILSFALDGETAYIADHLHGLRMVDISNPQNPIEVQRYSRYGVDYDVMVSGNMAYVRENLKLKIMDIADLQHPLELGFYELNWSYQDLKVVGNVGYMAQSSYDCIRSIDLSNPNSPSLLGTYTDETDVHYRLAVYDHYAYVVGNDGLTIVDIADPRNMQQIGFFNRNLGNVQIAVYDHFAYLQDRNEQLIALDLSDPTAPVVVGTNGLNEFCTDMKGDNGTLYVTTGNKLYLFDATNFQQWSPLAEVIMPAPCYL
jgi:hypothetical protein